MNYVPLMLLAFASMSAGAKINITHTTCNYQQQLAVSKGDVRLGWQCHQT